MCINNITLQNVHTFKYLGSKISDCGEITSDINHRISSACQAFGGLKKRVWMSHDLKLHTKLKLYETIVLSTLLYASETWTLLKVHKQKLNAFHLRCLRQILNVKWTDNTPNEEILKRSNMLNVEDLIKMRRLRWAGHVSRMNDNRLPNQIVFSQLKDGIRNRSKPKKRWIDTIKDDLNTLSINTNNWRDYATDRNSWRTLTNEAVYNRHVEKLVEKSTQRETRHEEDENYTWICPLCQFTRDGRQGRQYVNSHISQAHKESQPEKPPIKSLKCNYCDFEANSGSGLSSHVRHKHPEVEDNTIKPLRVVRSSPTPMQEPSSRPSTSTAPIPAQVAQWPCSNCDRVFKSKAGLSSHSRGNKCRRL